MRILLLAAEDSPRRGLWASQRWDLIVDLGKSSTFSATEWETESHCPILRTDSFRRGVEDVKLVRDMFAPGRGRLLDEEGIDWWDLTSLVVMPEAEAVLIFQRMFAEIGPEKIRRAEIWASRSNWAVRVAERLLQCTVQLFSQGRLSRMVARAGHYGELFRRFPAGQIKEIFLDRFDSDYKWRSRFASRSRPFTKPLILLPSAYGNVSRMATSYAALLPEQTFLLVATRRSAKQFEPTANVQVRDLAAYANVEVPVRETAAILANWKKLGEEMRNDPRLGVLLQSSAMNPISGWLHDGLRARNAWREVLEREPVGGVLCGDDSNIFTRLPVLLATRRQIPTVDFHHGALDGRYLLKEIPSDVYLAKNEMERDYLLRVCQLPREKISVGAPLSARAVPEDAHEESKQDSVVFFSEPYENAGMRTEEVYRELLPQLCQVARQAGRGVIVKLHPFESVSVRDRIVCAVLSEEDRRLVTIVDGPLSSRLLSRAWFGVTVESTTVIDCLLRGVPCFLCGWLTLSSFGYAQQYARFGVGETLSNVNEITDIPRRLRESAPPASQHPMLWKAAEPEQLRRWLAPQPRVEVSARRVS